MEKTIIASVRFIAAVFLLLAVGVQAQEDLVTNIILPAQPKTPTQFLKTLETAGLQPNLHLVANRGACNPSKGSFSVFGDVGSRLTFGIFVEPDDTGALVLQESFQTRLLIEVIAEDRETGLKNFWELIGEGQDSNWHYRGSSLDILADIEQINMAPTHKPVFGKRLRCSGCHTGGDLVMKELFPYNDWQKNEPLTSGPYRPSAVVRDIFQRAKPAHHLSEVVEKSLVEYVRRLEKRSPETEKQWTRSLLAPLEMNLASDLKPFRERLREGTDVELPAGFFVDSFLTGEQPPVRVPLAVYHQALMELGSEFAPDETTGLLETEHAFLVPVRSKFDTLRVESLLRRGLLDRELLSDLLAVDFRQPMYSQERLQVMELLPPRWSDAAELRKQLGTAPGAIGQNIREQERDAAFHRAQAIAYLEGHRQRAGSLEAVKEWLRRAHRRRGQIQAAQTSQNPRGSILEGGLGPDGFRRIFPQYRE